MLAHNVYFTLKDGSPAAKRKLVEASKKYLAPIPGIVFFACGQLVEDLSRPVNDREFHVALHVVFRDRKSHDEYQSAPLHNQFIDECRPNWAKVRVFDSTVEGAPPG